MYIAVNTNNVICGYCVNDIDFGKSYTKHRIDTDISNAFDSRDIPRLMFVDGQIIPRTQEEMDKDFNARPEPQPTQLERIEALEATTDDIVLMMADMIGG